MGGGANFRVAWPIPPHEQGLRRIAAKQRMHDPNSHDQPDEPALGPMPGVETVAFDERVFKNNTMT